MLMKGICEHVDN